MKYKHKIPQETLCPIEYGLDVFGGKWKARILCVLSMESHQRYGDIKTELNNISDTVLAAMLKELIENGLVRRRAYDEMPPRVEYALSEKGESVLPILQSICRWAREQTKDRLEKKLAPCRNCSQTL
jgi:DNA-binding HxlR family transcriptional regulator